MTELAVAVAQLAGTEGELRASVHVHAQLATLAAEHGARLVLFPELSLTGYHLGYTSADAIDASDERLEALQGVANAHDITVVAGAPLASPAGLVIGSLRFAPRSPVTLHSKRFLGAGEEIAFAPGRGGSPLALADQVAAFAICADIKHAEHASDAAARGATIYAASCLVSAADFATDAELLAEYAREHRMLVLMANYAPPVPDWIPAGRSAIWSTDGALLASAPPRGRALVIARRAQGGWTGTVVSEPK